VISQFAIKQLILRIENQEDQIESEKWKQRQMPCKDHAVVIDVFALYDKLY